MASGPSFESDLRAVREARGLSLTEIHQHTRIPVDVLRRFEDGELVTDPTYNQVYLKAILQSYAKAVGIPPGAVLVAYEDQQAGAYRGALHPSGGDAPEADEPAAADAPPAREPAETPAPKATRPEPPPSKADAPEAEPPAAEPPKAETPKPTSRPAASGAPPAVAALRETPDPGAARADKKPKTLAEVRGSRPAISTTDKTFDRNWTGIVGLFVVVLVLVAGALYWLVFTGDDDGADAPDDLVAEVDPATNEAATDSAAAPAPAPSGPTLELPITVDLIAGGDGLQSFRVTEDDGARRPYWIEPGVTQTFTGQQSVTLWGEDPTADFSEATVEFQGLRFTPASGRELVISAANGQALLDSLAAR